MIDVYSLPHCSKCNSTKTALIGKGLVEGEHWVEHDLTLSENEDARNWVMEDLGYQEAPIVVTDDDHWSGFRPDKLVQLRPRKNGDSHGL